MRFNNGGSDDYQKLPKALRSVVGLNDDYMYGEVQDYRPDIVTVILNLSDTRSSKKDGIHIDGVLQTRSDGVTWDVMKYVPVGASFAYKRHSLVTKILDPVRTVGVLASADWITGSRAEVYSLTSDFPRVLLHETNHLYDVRKDPEVTKRLYGLVAGHNVTRMAEYTSPLVFLLDLNPWLLTIPFITGVGTYLLSRDPDNRIGKGLITQLRSEKRSYLMDAILRKLMQNNGFAIQPFFKGSERERQYVGDLDRPAHMKGEFFLVYELLTWAMIDVIRSAGKEDNREAPRPSPVPVAAYARLAYA